MPENPALARMIRPLPTDRRGRETGAARAWRLNVPKLADARLGLVVSVEGVEQSGADHAAVLSRWPDDGLAFLLDRGEARGLAVVDAQLRAALIEVKTMGRVISTRPAERPGTDVDLALTAPAVSDWIGAVGAETGCAMAGWCPGRRLASARAAGMALPEGVYGLTDITLSLGGNQRTGRLTIALPGLPEMPEAAEPDEDMSRRMLALLARYTSDLQVILCRQDIALSELRALEVGSEIALDHRALAAVTIEADAEGAMARGRLGRMGDRKAVKLASMDGDAFEPVAEMFMDARDGGVPRLSPLTDAEEAGLLPDQ